MEVIGDKGYAALGFVFPPKKNTRYDTGKRVSRHPKLRKRIEPVFSQLVAAQVRSVRTQTHPGLRLRVMLAVLAHNLGRPSKGFQVTWKVVEGHTRQHARRQIFPRFSIAVGTSRYASASFIALKRASRSRLRKYRRWGPVKVGAALFITPLT